MLAKALVESRKRNIEDSWEEGSEEGDLLDTVDNNDTQPSAQNLDNAKQKSIYADKKVINKGRAKKIPEFGLEDDYEVAYCSFMNNPRQNSIQIG